MGVLYSYLFSDVPYNKTKNKIPPPAFIASSFDSVLSLHLLSWFFGILTSPNKPEDNKDEINRKKNVAEANNSEYSEKNVKGELVILNPYSRPRYIINESCHVQNHHEKCYDARCLNESEENPHLSRCSAVL